MPDLPSSARLDLGTDDSPIHYRNHRYSPLVAESQSAAQLVSQSLRELRTRIERACARAGRSPSEVTLVGASKRQPLERLAAAHAAGLRVFGENRVQEAETKKPALAPEIEWHLIGPLQSNKVRRAVELFDVIQSVDRLKIARAIGRESMRHGRSMDCFIELNLGSEDSKHGFQGEQPRAVLDCFEIEGLRPIGLMAIPPQEDNAERQRFWFRELRNRRDWLRRCMGDRFEGALSMGMSNDFEIAIEEGATHIRVGTSLFGERLS